MKIQEVELKTGLDRATIRFYEKEGLLIPERQENGYRSYTQENLELLNKVKLLRQLGISIQKIKLLQTGTDSLAEVLDEQIIILDQHIKDDLLAKAVCEAMREDGVSYNTLDTSIYWTMLQKYVPAVQPYAEPIEQPFHPWRRHIARILDINLSVLFLNFIYYTIFRVRLQNELIDFLFPYLGILCSIPLEGWFLSRFGTTPGKWVMGIHIENANGGRLTFREAFHRCWQAVIWGMAFGLPPLILWREWKSYKNAETGEGNIWESDSELIYSDFGFHKGFSFAALCILMTVLSVFIAVDRALPRHRNSDLTLERFVENYNDYAQTLDPYSQFILAEDGTWRNQNELYPDQIVVDIATLQGYERKDFSYDYDENQSITRVHYQNSWINLHPTMQLPADCRTAVYAVVGGRPGATQQDIAQVDEFTLELLEHLSVADTNGTYSGTWNILDVTVSWTYEVCDDPVLEDGLTITGDILPVEYTLDLQIGIE